MDVAQEKQTAGFMTDSDTTQAIKDNKMRIAPYNPNNLTPVGYNFSFSKFIISLKTRQFQKINIEKDGSLYFTIKPFETVLALTNEAIWVSKEIGGTFHSKVSLVANGLGHVSTTLDPGWQGQLLIPMNNPTKRSIKVYIGKKDDTNGEVSYKYGSFITLVLYRAVTASSIDSDNKENRYDLLNKLLSSKNEKRYKPIKAAITEMELNIKNNRIDYEKYAQPKREQMLIEHFDKNYKNISSIIERIYNDEIDAAADTMVKRNKLFFASLVSLMVISTIAIILVGLMCPSRQWLSSTLLPVLIPIYIAVFGPLKNKLL